MYLCFTNDKVINDNNYEWIEYIVKFRVQLQSWLQTSRLWCQTATVQFLSHADDVAGSEMRVCHVGLCATHLHCCFCSTGLTFKPVLCFKPGEKRSSSIAGALVARRHISADGDIEAVRWRNARRCVDLSHNWLMHPRPTHPSVCYRCCVSKDGFMELFKLSGFVFLKAVACLQADSFCLGPLLKCVHKFPPCTTWQRCEMSRFRQAAVAHVLLSRSLHAQHTTQQTCVQ